MARTVSDAELAARIRRQNREGSQRRREKQRDQGKVQLGGLWIPAPTKQRLETLAANAGMPLSEVVALAIERLDSAEVDATAHLMSSPTNAARLMEAIHDHRAGRNMRARELPPDAD